MLSSRSSVKQTVVSTERLLDHIPGYPGPVTSPSDVESDLGWALGTVMRSYLRIAEEAVADVPGGPRGYQVLSSAARGNQGSQLAMAQRLGVDRTVMTYLLDDLERAGLVERRPDPADRRARRVVLTEAGNARLCDVERRLRRVEEHLLGPLEPAERDTLRTLLQRVAVASGEERVDACEVAADMDRC
jgi:DNA-binding MarR family transcriptional regulator